MSKYFVGDIQGCYQELRLLLEAVDFNPSKDELWAVGDLVARGPDSLATLEYLYGLENSAKVVLGNHDLHLLALAAGVKKRNPKDLLDPLLDSPHLPKLVDWIRQQPLVRYLPEHNVIMSHAGVPPQWGLETLLFQSNEVSDALKSEMYIESLISKMYHNKQSRWHDGLSDFDKLKFTIDALTRMRFLHQDGSLDFNCKLPAAQGHLEGLKPWFEVNSKLRDKNTLVFGHWAALIGKVPHSQLIALDTGCVWGGVMTLWHLETNEKFTQKRLK
ncbi:bis(5'-nucleosyl)-tetraphosphatase [Shewanella sp. OPT22]|nr:bis(5'-nucleosyl)-tetraphosphatase [Shewanella sp. OPT22]